MSLTEDRTPPAAERQAPASDEEVLEQHREPPATTARRPRRRRVLLLGAALVLAIAIGVGGTLWWLSARNWASTDDAFIDAHTVQVSPQIAGRVARVLVDDNSEVHAGQPLVEIDPADLDARLAQAVANRQSAAGKLAQAKAQLTVAGANLDEAQAMVGVAEADATNAATNLNRDRKLVQMHSMALSRQQLDNDTAAARRSAANLRAAEQKAAAAKAQVALAKTQEKTAAADLAAAKAQTEQTRLSRSYAEIRAPTAGHIVHKSVAAGDYVQTGQQLMVLVPDDVWVTANFKETDLAYLRVGQPVEIDVDAYPGKTFHGHVDSIQSGSGAAFSLLPPENATGNYVKVVQRVPVKIVFDHPPAARWVLGPGMSVVPHVRIR